MQVITPHPLKNHAMDFALSGIMFPLCAAHLPNRLPHTGHNVTGIGCLKGLVDIRIPRLQRFPLFAARLAEIWRMIPIRAIDDHVSAT